MEAIMKLNKLSAKQITGIAVLLALVIVLQSLGGTIVIGAVQLNFTLIPIVLGAILFGPLVGAFLGFCVRCRGTYPSHRRFNTFLRTHLDERPYRDDAHLPCENDGGWVHQRLAVQARAKEKSLRRGIRCVGHRAHCQYVAFYPRLFVYDRFGVRCGGR